MNETGFLEKADHPFIISFKECFPYNEEDPVLRYCIVLEYADGCDLRSKLNQRKHIPEKIALTWFTQACLGLMHMHDKGKAHRDLKPENILIVGEICGGMAKIGDFGSVKDIFLDDNQTIGVGTLMYFAPEKLSSSHTEKVDLWSMGIILYEMLTGNRYPFEYDYQKGNLLDYVQNLKNLKLK